MRMIIRIADDDHILISIFLCSSPCLFLFSFQQFCEWKDGILPTSAARFPRLVSFVLRRGRLDCFGCVSFLTADS